MNKKTASSGSGQQRIKFICCACRWFDKINGNTYHSVRITRTSDKATITQGLTYGYGAQYMQTALKLMLTSGWIKAENDKDKLWLWERENNYPIYWEVKDGSKRDLIQNATD